MKLANLNNLAIATISFFIPIAGLLHAHSPRQLEAPSANLLDKPLGNIDSTRDPTTEAAFARLLHWADMSGGIVEIESCRNPEKASEVKRSFVFSGLTVRQALNIITSDGNRYRWEPHGNLVDLVPANGIPEALKARIAHLETNPDDSISSAGAKLLEIAEMRKAFPNSGRSPDGKVETRTGRVTLVFSRRSIPQLVQ